MDFLGSFITIFGFLLYLEIIELGFCELNYNTRKNIEKRRVDEILQNYGHFGYEGFNSFKFFLIINYICFNEFSIEK